MNPQRHAVIPEHAQRVSGIQRNALATGFRVFAMRCMAPPGMTRKCVSPQRPRRIAKCEYPVSELCAPLRPSRCACQSLECLPLRGSEIPEAGRKDKPGKTVPSPSGGRLQGEGETGGREAGLGHVAGRAKQDARAEGQDEGIKILEPRPLLPTPARRSSRANCAAIVSGNVFHRKDREGSRSGC